MFTIVEIKVNAAKNVVATAELFKTDVITNKVKSAVDYYVEMKNKLLKINGSDNRIIVEYVPMNYTSVETIIANLHVRTLKDAESYNHIAKTLNRAIKATNKVNMKNYSLIEEIDIVKLDRELKFPIKKND